PRDRVVALCARYGRRQGLAGDDDVGCRERGCTLQRCDELRSVGAVAVGVVIEVPGGSVVDQAVARIPPGSEPGTRDEAHVTGYEVAGRAERSELAIVEYKLVRAG